MSALCHRTHVALLTFSFLSISIHEPGSRVSHRMGASAASCKERTYTQTCSVCWDVQSCPRCASVLSALCVSIHLFDSCTFVLPTVQILPPSLAASGAHSAEDLRRRHSWPPPFCCMHLPPRVLHLRAACSASDRHPLAGRWTYVPASSLLKRAHSRSQRPGSNLRKEVRSRRLVLFDGKDEAAAAAPDEADEAAALAHPFDGATCVD
jgi:hypothetical protein